MEEKNKEVQKLDDDVLEVAVGGYRVGKDKHSITEYNEAGVTWERNTFSKDKYYFDGKKISQSDAEAIATAYKFGMRKRPD